MSVRRAVSCAAAAALIAAVPVVTALPAAAAPTWSVVSSPSPPGPQYGTLNAVACPTTSSCVTVGNTAYSYLTSPKPITQVWNGSGWSTQPITFAASLSGVACISATSCFAVGGFGAGTLAHWDGTSWSNTTHPDSGPLTAISCPSPTSCFAVGALADNGSGYLLHWDGTTWSTMSHPSTDYLFGVSCASSSFCVAVGQSAVEHWNGTSWSTVAHAGTGQLNGVSCTSSSFCVAVGQSAVEHWNGTSWATVANPSGAANQVLANVSCTSTTDCMAVGSSRADANSDTVPLAEQWNGTSWSIVATPTPPEYSGYTNSALSGVTCRATGNCVAVGTSRVGAALVERWNGTDWSLDPPPTNFSQSGLARVACPTPTSCVAVGNFFDGETTTALVERSTGTSLSTWSVDPLPDLDGESTLAGLTCRSATDCVAVGSAGEGTGSTLIERWNGTSWSVVPSPDRHVNNQSTENGLLAVSCPSATTCFAVGQAGFTTLVERWNGATWTIVPSPNPHPAHANTLSDVACTSATKCFAVGNTNNAQGRSAALIERWNGTKWTVVPSATRAPNKDSSLSGVSCTSATSCTAVGYDLNKNDWSRTLVERWNGTKWAIVASPSPNPGGLGSGLNHVTCTSATNCTAVGSTTSVASLYNFPTKAIIERWNGTEWTLVAHPNLTGSPYNFLNGVSCPSGTRCVAVGSNTTDSGERTLVERDA